MKRIVNSKCLGKTLLFPEIAKSNGFSIGGNKQDLRAFGCIDAVLKASRVILSRLFSSCGTSSKLPSRMGSRKNKKRFRFMADHVLSATVFPGPSKTQDS